MRWCHIYQAGMRGTRNPGLNIDAFLVYGYGNEMRAGSKQGSAYTRIAGFFNPDGIPRIDQQAGHEVQRLLRSGDNDDLFSLTANGAGNCQVRRDCAAEWQVPSGFPKTEKVARVSPPLLLHELCPESKRESVHCRDGRLKGLRPARRGEKS